MTVRDFLEQVVRRNLDDFETDQSDFRLAFNALAAVDAVAARMFVWLQENKPAAVSRSSDDSHYRAELAGQNRDFLLVRDFAKAQKHGKLIRHRPVTGHASQMASRQVGYGQGGYGDSPYGGGMVVAIELNDGGLAILKPTLNRALAFLEGVMVLIATEM